MTLLAPVWLVVGMLALVVLALHVRKRKLIDVPSILLWRMIDPPAAPRPKIKPPPMTILLILQLLIVLLAALALARPFFGLGEAPLHRIYLIDVSASMRATDIAPTRFDAAMADLRRRIAGTPDDGSRATVIAVGTEATIHVARQTGPDGMLPILDLIAPTDGAADWSAAAALVASVRMPGEAAHIFVLSDGADAAAAEAVAALDVPADRVVFASSRPENASLAGDVTVVDAAGGTWRLAGTVTSTGRAGTIAVAVAFHPAHGEGFLEWTELAVPLDAAGAGAFDTMITLPGPGAIRLSLPGDDAPADNSLQFVVGATTPPRILFVGTDNDALARALEATGPVALFEADTLPAAADTFDLVIFDNVVADRRPATNSLWLGGAYLAGEMRPGVLPPVLPTAWRSGHPLSADIDWGVVPATVAYLTAALQGAERVVEAGAAPLVESRMTTSGREIRLNLELGETGWVDQPSFPIFVRNIVGWLGIGGTQSVAACVVGRECNLPARLAGQDILPLSDGAIAVLADARVDEFVPERAGLYRVGESLLAVNPSPGEGIERVLEPTTGTALPAVWQQPVSWWLLLAIFVLLGIEGWIAGRGPERFLLRTGLAASNPLSGRHRLLLALRIGAIALVVVALFEVPLPGREQAEDLVLVAAADPSGAPDTAAAIAARAGADIAGAGDGARAGLVTLAAEPAITADLGPPAGLETTAPRAGMTGADIAAALRLAAAMLPADRPGHIVFAADGTETAGHVAAALPAVVARGLTVDAAPLPAYAEGEVLVATVTAPQRIREGDAFPVQASIFTGVDRTAQVTVFRDGEPIVDTVVTLLRGTNRIDATIPDAVAGRATIEVAVTAAGDVVADNNRAGIIVEVDVAPSLAIITPDLAWGQYFADALAIQNLAPDVLHPTAAPRELAGWLGYDAVILMNIPALDLNTVQQEQLEQAVEAHGLGLLILGGENSFGPGGYYETALERLSPLSSRVPRDAPQSAIVFVIDRSGSMQALAGGGSRLDIAKAATIRAIELLQDDTDVSIVVFDSMAHVILPLQPKAQATAAIEAIETIQAGGGTALQPALLQALAQLEGSDAAVRHIVIMTDGLSAPGDLFAALQRARGQTITISSVAIGQGADEALLRQIANIGGGNFASTRDFAALPSILAREALLLAGSPVRNRASPVSWLDRDAVFLAGAPDELPPIRSFVLTSAKPEADVHLGVADIDDTVAPLLASWRYGSGRVLAFAAHGAGPGARDWMALPEYPLLWAQIVRHFLPEIAEPGLNVRLAREGDEVLVTADLVGEAGEPLTGLLPAATLATPNGVPLAVALMETAPGRYQGRAIAIGTGNYTATVTGAGFSAERAILVSYPSRYDFSRADPTLPGRIATATGGDAIGDGKAYFTSGSVWVAREGWWLWLLVALSLFTLDLTIRHAPGLLGLARRSRPPRTSLAAAA